MSETERKTERKKMPRLPDLGAALGMTPMQEKERTPEEVEQDLLALQRLFRDVVK